LNLPKGIPPDRSAEGPVFLRFFKKDIDFFKTKRQIHAEAAAGTPGFGGWFCLPILFYGREGNFRSQNAPESLKPPTCIWEEISL